MSRLALSPLLAVLALVGACGQTPAEPDPAETLDIAVAAGDPDIAATAQWSVGGSTVVSTVAALTVRNGFITVRFESGTGNALQVIVPTRAGDIAITGTGLTSDEASVRITRAGVSSPLVGSISVGRVRLRNDDGRDVIVELDIDLRGATLTGVGSVTGSGTACLDRHPTVACGDDPPQS
jgi:hypothetical protein